MSRLAEAQPSLQRTGAYWAHHKAPRPQQHYAQARQRASRARAWSRGASAPHWSNRPNLGVQTKHAPRQAGAVHTPPQPLCNLQTWYANLPRPSAAHQHLVEGHGRTRGTQTKNRTAWQARCGRAGSAMRNPIGPNTQYARPSPPRDPPTDAVTDLYGRPTIWQASTQSPRTPLRPSFSQGHPGPHYQGPYRRRGVTNAPTTDQSAHQSHFDAHKCRNFQGKVSGARKSAARPQNIGGEVFEQGFDSRACGASVPPSPHGFWLCRLGRFLI